LKITEGRTNIPVDRNSVSNVQSIDTLNLAKRVGRINTPDISSVSVKREVVLDSLRLGGIEAENTSPLLDRLSVVVGAKGGVNATVVDLETGAGTSVTGVHALDDVGPVSSGLVDVSLGAGGVPGVDGTGGGDEAASGDTRVSSGSSKQLRVGSGHDILCFVSILQFLMKHERLTVIIAPELEPVTKTFLGSALYFLRAYETMLAMALLSPPPLCFKDFCEETSQQVPL
jgi:hypothetical protein